MLFFLQKKDCLSRNQSAIREAPTVLSRLPSQMAADKPRPLLQPSLCNTASWYITALRLCLTTACRLHISSWWLFVSFVEIRVNDYKTITKITYRLMRLPSASAARRLKSFQKISLSGTLAARFLPSWKSQLSYKTSHTHLLSNFCSNANMII